MLALAPRQALERLARQRHHIHPGVTIESWCADAAPATPANPAAPPTAPASTFLITSPLLDQAVDNRPPRPPPVVANDGSGSHHTELSSKVGTCPPITGGKILKKHAHQQRPSGGCFRAVGGR